MLFSELQFFLFFAGYLLLHFAVPAKFRVYLVIAGGTVFYSWWRLDFIWVPYLLTVLAFTGVAWMEATEDPRTRSRRLIAVVTLILAPLIVVKYSYFIAANVASLLGSEYSNERLASLKFSLPLGISFITFTAIAYVVDVYRRRYLPEKRISIVLAYVMFFPHLIAGPILRPHELMPQLKQLRAALGARFLIGAGIFTLGLFKKLVIADQLPSSWIQYLPKAPRLRRLNTCWPFTDSRHKSTVISAATPTWQLAWPIFSVSASRQISSGHTRQLRLSTSGADGMSPCPIGCATICTFLWAEAALVQRGEIQTC